MKLSSLWTGEILTFVFVEGSSMYNQEAFHSGKAISIVVVLVPLLTYCLSMV